MNFKFKKFIIFDFDGTLVDSLPDITIAINLMLKELGLPVLSIEDVNPLVGNGAKVLVIRSLQIQMDKINLTDSLVDQAFEVYLSAYKTVVCKETFVYPNVIETLEYLQSKNYQMVICSNKPYEFIEPILERLSIKKFFLDWIGEHSLQAKKPDPAPLLFLMEKYKMKLSQCVMVGDSKNDILAAKNSKMDSIGVSYGYNYNQSIADYNPNFVVDDFSELKTIF